MEDKQQYVLKSITKLVRDYRCKDLSCYRCGVCDFEISQRMSTGDTYSLCKNDMIEHVKYKHPKYCYKCYKCKNLYTTKGELKHKCEYVIINNSKIIDYSDVEKTRVLKKLNYEGGLLGYMGYGLAPRLYHKFKDDFKYFYAKEDLLRELRDNNRKFTRNEKLIKQQFKEFETIVIAYLSVSDANYNDDELNAVNYVFDEIVK